MLAESASDKLSIDMTFVIVAQKLEKLFRHTVLTVVFTLKSLPKKEEMFTTCGNF